MLLMLNMVVGTDFLLGWTENPQEQAEGPGMGVERQFFHPQKGVF